MRICLHFWIAKCDCPGLNPIEPKWVHAKRRVVAPARLLTARELEERVYAAFAHPVFEHLTIPQEVA